MKPGAIVAALIMLVAVLAAAAAAELEAGSRIDAVTVYPDGATVVRTIAVAVPAGDTRLIARDFPLTLDPASLRVEGEGGVTIGSIEAQPERPRHPAELPALEQRLEALRDQRAALDDAIAAAALRKQFVERFAATVPLGLGDQAEARPLEEWRAAFAAVGEEVAIVDTALREARLKQRTIDREIADLEAKLKASPPRRMEVRIDLAAAAPAQAALRVTYSVRGARWMPLYDARLDSGGAGGKAALALVRRAEIVQGTGEDWDGVALSLSTLRAARGGAAPELPALIVRLLPERQAATSVRDGAPAPAASPPSRAASVAQDKAEEREAAVEAGAFQAVFRVPGRVSIASRDGATALRIGTTTVEPELLVRATPSLDPTAFLEASFPHAEDAPLLPGRVALYRDGVFVGRSLLKAAARGETVRLGFGADERIAVTHVAVRRSEGSAGIITSSKTDEREFRITVRNGHAQKVRLAIEDRLPVSVNDAVTVELLPATTQPTGRDIDGRRGVLAWEFEAAPGEQREIKLAWRVRWPAERAIVYGGTAR